jgi:hypothetical protein
MRRQDRFSDLQFVCQAERSNASVQVINAHQAVLSTVSNLLRDVFKIANDKQPYEKIVITLDSFDPIIVGKLVDYIYEGQIMVNHQQQHEFRGLCKLLQIEVPLRRADPQIPIDDGGETSGEMEFAKFSNCDFYDNWKSDKIGLTRSEEVKPFDASNEYDSNNGAKNIDRKVIAVTTTNVNMETDEVTTDTVHEKLLPFSEIKIEPCNWYLSNEYEDNATGMGMNPLKLEQTYICDTKIEFKEHNKQVHINDFDCILRIQIGYIYYHPH